MNLNAESRFAEVPHADIQRSRFDRPFQHKTTFSAGSLVPFYVDEVLPGDTVSMDTSLVCRMMTPLVPVMDNANLDVYYFFVPNRILWKHWKNFMGENTDSKWTPATDYVVPQIKFPLLSGWSKGSVADYMGLPTQIPYSSGEYGSTTTCSHLPFRAYAMIWNEFFRDQNLQDPVLISDGDEDVQGVTSESDVVNYQQSALYGGKLLPVNKYHDYFTSALPQPQKGQQVLLPLGQSAPVVSTGLKTQIPVSGQPLNWYSNVLGTPLEVTGNHNLLLSGSPTSSTPAYTAYDSLPNTSGGISQNLVPGLEADLTQATAATINELRLAFQVQRLLERDARGGTRYREMILSHFGVTSPDARMMVPEFLGGKRIPVNIDQVIQQSATQTNTTPLGNTAAFSLTGDADSSFTKSFVEHGLLIGVLCVRNENTYQQGMEKFWSRKHRLDYYFPVLANIGEQPILNKEIYMTGTATDNEVFGYQEAFADYRYKPSRVSSSLRSNVDASLDVWTYADYYESLPYLSDSWIRSSPANIDRSLAVQSSLDDQFIIDIYCKADWYRPMPLYSVPGLLDHN